VAAETSSSRAPASGRAAATAGFRRQRQQAIGSAKKRRQTQKDQIDACDTDRDIAGRHHAFVEQPIQQIEHRRIGRAEELVGDSRFRVVPCSRHDVTPE
jgi:hypothetical protein